jgi:hypothetical protein
VNPDGLCGGNLPCYKTIQLAHANVTTVAGDMILVAPAVYNFTGTFDVTKQVSIIGPNANINAVPSTGSTRVPGDALSEAILNANAGVTALIRVRASNVEINGFEMRGSTLDQVQTLVTTPVSNLRVSYNIMHNVGDDAFQLRAVNGAFVECNYIYAVGGDAVNVCCGSNNMTIRNNEIENAGTPDGAITTVDTPNSLVEGNYVHVVPNGSGIQIGASSGANVGLGGNTIVANIVSDVGRNGISLLQSNSVVRCNDVSGARGTAGILSEYAVANNAMTENSVHNNPLAIAGPSGLPAGFYFGAAVLTPSFTVTNNSIVGNAPFGMLNHAVPALTAQGNWWGDITGPSGAGPGIGDAVGPNILFNPWLTSPPPPPCQSSTVCADRPTPTLQDATWGRIKAQYR